ncbi:hypothetical protein L3X38_000157 (mitochondrion) [Prunus dulcis]|uniref:Uncharacterized protein n=1 Tax=Prunus dulcis TaxID=3755 RepID=A0AAD4UT61_PRUDU|nr:hypothetical protein L3X38_000157 [Prunus dulcis]
MRDLPPIPRNRSSGGLPSAHLSIYRGPSPEAYRSSRMSMSWIPGFILVLIHHGIFGIYKNILGEGNEVARLKGEGEVMIFEKITRCISGRIGGRKANCLLAGSCMSGNVHVRLREKGGADTPARITGDGYKNGGEVNSTRRHSGMDVDPSGRDNHSGPGRGGDHSQEPKRLS